MTLYDKTICHAAVNCFGINRPPIGFVYVYFWSYCHFVLRTDLLTANLKTPVDTVTL
jgi:hypothetical protein